MWCKSKKCVQTGHIEKQEMEMEMETEMEN